MKSIKKILNLILIFTGTVIIFILIYPYRTNNKNIIYERSPFFVVLPLILYCFIFVLANLYLFFENQKNALYLFGLFCMGIFFSLTFSFIRSGFIGESVLYYLISLIVFLILMAILYLVYFKSNYERIKGVFTIKNILVLILMNLLINLLYLI
jgi:hypothetical protein